MDEPNFNFRYVRLCNLNILKEKKTKLDLCANSGDPDQTQHSALGMDYLPSSLLGSNFWFSFASAVQLFLAVEFDFYVLGDVALMS